MKTSLCSIAFRNEPRDIGDIVHLAADVGYDSVEVWGNHLDSEAHIRRLEAAVDRTGLSVAMLSPYFDLTGSRRALEESLAAAESWATLARRLGSPLIRAFTGVVGSDQATPEQRRSCIEGLRRMCDLAQGQGVCLALETHPKTLVDTVPATLRLLDEVGHSHLVVNLDIYHAFEAQGDAVEALRLLYPHVAHVHAKNALLSHGQRSPDNHPLLHDRQAKQAITGVTSLADGDMPYAPFLRELERLGFPGAVSVEWFGKDPALAAEIELDYLRSVLPSLGERQPEATPAVRA